MTNKPKPITKKALRQMFSRQLEESVAKARSGLLPPDEGETVIPHGLLNEVVVAPGVAWSDAQYSLNFLGKKAPPLLPLPPGWAAFVQSLPDFPAIPMACGHFPQLMKNPWNLPASLDEGKSWEGKTPLPEMESWLSHPKQGVARTLVAAGICRLAGELDSAHEFLDSIKKEIPPGYYQNESGAEEWARGRRQAAQGLWETAGDLPMARFNLGLAHACAGDLPLARNCFQQALGAIPTHSGWHHLAALYMQA